MNRVQISGIGAISAAGNNVKETLETFLSLKRNAGKVSVFPSEMDLPVFEVPGLISAKYKRTSDLLFSALREALSDAALENCKGKNIGISIGTTVASQLNDLDFYRKYRSVSEAPVRAVNSYLKNNLASAVKSTLGSVGPDITVVNACSSGSDAIGIAYSWVRSGICDMAIAGGADEINLVPLCGFNSLSIYSKSLCMPFDRDRTGLNLGEGAGVIILESERSAEKREKVTNIFLSGYGSASDAYHLTSPHPDGKGLKLAITKAMKEAAIEDRNDIDFINAHGTATPENDRIEASVISEIFDKSINVLSTKGFTGHTLGAAGGIEAVFTISSLQNGWIPASAGFINKAEDIPIVPVTCRTDVNKKYAMSTSLAFGGSNAALIFERK